jgi:3-phosphoshikimate 1-carboxyvinyltransferase
MINAVVFPKKINASIHAPTSKSCMQRACAAALIRKGISKIYNYGKSNDDNAALEIIQQLGAKVIIEEDYLKIISDGKIYPATSFIHCNESGLSIRMFTPIAALSSQPIEIRGSGSLKARPMNFFDEVLPQLNVNSSSQAGKLPLHVCGPLQPKNIIVDGSLSSQFLTGLLIAYSASDAKDVAIQVNDLKSKPYIDLTLDVMKSFGLKIPVNNNYESFYFSNEEFHLTTHEVNYTVEGDWSGAAFLLVAGAIAGNVKVKGLQLNSSQADKAIIDALKSAGAELIFEENEINVSSSSLKSFEFDATECPDLFPPLAALAAFCNGTSKIKGVSRLAHKESNRGETIKQEFAKLGVNIKLIGEIMYINGIQESQYCIVSSHHDHRIAMACAIVGLRANGKIQIEHADAINKSYPNFFTDLKQLGVEVDYM